MQKYYHMNFEALPLSEKGCVVKESYVRLLGIVFVRVRLYACLRHVAEKILVKK